MSDLPLARLIAAGLCLVSGSFVLGAETTLVSLPETRLRALLDELGPARGRHIARYLADPTRVLSRLLAYRITAIIVASTLATDALVRSGDRPLKLVAIVGVLTFLYGALAEIFTSVARSQAWRLAAPALAVTRPLELLMLPMAAPLAWLGRRIHRESAAGARSQSSAVSEREMEYLVEEAENAGTIDARRGEMMQRVLELKDRSARDVMVPRTNINAIDASTPIERALSLVTAEGHSRVPVFRGQIDNIVGILHVKDLFRVAAGQKLERPAETNAEQASPAAMTVEDVARRPPLFVSHNESALGMLREMQSRRKHMAIVLDEFGAVIGLVALEDIIEELVGDIQDEHDTEESPFVDQGDGRYLASAAIPIGDLAENLGTEFPAAASYASLGGFMAERAGVVPRVGTTVEWNGWRFLVREGDDRKATTVEISRLRSPDSSGAAAHAE